MNFYDVKIIMIAKITHFVLLTKQLLFTNMNTFFLKINNFITNESL